VATPVGDPQKRIEFGQMANVSKSETQLKMIQAVCHLMDQGVSVGEISGIAVTEYCSVDKMYVNRYFGDLPDLLMETIQYLLTEEMPSMLSSDVFPKLGTFSVNPHIEKAFKLATYLSGQEAFADRLVQLGEVVSGVYAKQLQDNFGLKPSHALSEAKFGIMLIAGYLSFGSALNLGQNEIQDFLNRRLESLKNQV